LLAGVSLRQREWDHADGYEQKRVKGTSNKMSFNGGIDLLFHIGLMLFLFKSWVPVFPKRNYILGAGRPFYAGTQKNVNTFF
jgi:hypothetical protein